MADKDTNTPEPEVVKAVKAEIKKLGEGTKANTANYTELRKSYEELKSLIDKNDGKVDGLVQEKMTKLTEDITIRQEALDTKIDKEKAESEASIEAERKKLDGRIDKVEAAFKRTPKSGIQTKDEEVQEYKDAKLFQKNSLTVRAKNEGVSPKVIEDMEINVEGYRNYQKSLRIFLRTDDRRLDPECVKALTVGIDPDGGYTVTPAMSNRVITRLWEDDPVRSLSASESITTGVLEWMVDFDEAGWGWEGETETGVETDTPQFFKKQISVHTMYAKPQASQTLLEDSGINIENWLADKVASRFLRGEGAAFVTGNGVGKPRGFLTYGNGINYGQIERTNMQAAGALTADGFIAVKYSLIERYLNRGTWLMNRSTVRDTLYLKDGSGNYIWKPAWSADTEASILSLPVRMSTTMPAVAAGIQAVALADWKEAYMVVDRLGITIQRDPYTVKPMVEFYTRKRVGGDVVNYQAIKLGNIAV